MGPYIYRSRITYRSALKGPPTSPQHGKGESPRLRQQQVYLEIKRDLGKQLKGPAHLSLSESCGGYLENSAHVARV